jgi:diguanylate cyclase (GGDEF)-like protein
LVGNELRALNTSGEPFASRLSAREGIAGYVIGRGHRYVRGDELLGPIVHRLAERSHDGPVWCFPIVYEQQVLGLVSVGQVWTAAEQDIGLLESLGCVIALLWGRLVDRERMMVARQTDHGSGVLERGALFAAGERALSDSYAEHEPVLAMVIALEGMRRLDDAGLWEGRDAAVERAGRAIRRKLRSDDVVGRFSDDRFVALMRRLDTSLGRMIAEKMIAAVRRELQKVGGDVATMSVRCGLAGTGQEKPSLEKLLADAFAACDRARKANIDLVDDLAPTPQEGTPSVTTSGGDARRPGE